MMGNSLGIWKLITIRFSLSDFNYIDSDDDEDGGELLYQTTLADENQRGFVWH